MQTIKYKIIATVVDENDVEIYSIDTNESIDLQVGDEVSAIPDPDGEIFGKIMSIEGKYISLDLGHDYTRIVELIALEPPVEEKFPR